jgi:hypothetical protein
VQGLPQPAGPAALSRRALALALTAAALVAAGCGSDDPDKDEKLELPPGFNLQLFNCADWKAADKPLRQYVLDQLHEISGDQITGPGVQGRGRRLSDEDATNLFNNRCADPRARGFVLYKIYAFARGFRGRQPGT